MGAERREAHRVAMWSRLGYGRKYCHDSPPLDEDQRKQVIMNAINSVMSEKGNLIRQIDSMIEREQISFSGESV